ncbi:MAG: CerR family C-terminal domain-containing protein [Planctomycetes bacterium]|nr:CerR family C-terminal domain-containing protein [Planctomycetota bacterium]
MANVKNNASSVETQRKLLEAAGRVFAEKGFHSATIKEITKAAGTSLASVNYHFRDKAELYAAVLRRIEQDKQQMLPPDEVLVGTPEQRFRAFVTHLVTTMLRRGQPVWERVLLAREFAEPTPTRDSLFENLGRPLHRGLAVIIGELTGRPKADREVELAAVSVIAQCIYHLQHQAYLVDFLPSLVPAPRPDEIAAQIVAFSLHGLQSLRRPQP